MTSLSFPPLESNESRYLLLDGAQCRTSPQRLLKAPWVAEQSPLFNGTLADGSGDVAPYLARLRAPEDISTALRALRSSGAAEEAACFLDSSLGHEEVALRLSRRLATSLPNGKHMLLRTYDSRVLPHLAAVVDPDQSIAFFALARRWWYRSHQHRWEAIPGTTPMRDLLAGPIELSADQRRSLQDACYPYAVIAHFRDSSPELLDSLAEEVRYVFFRDTIRVAGQFNVTNAAEVTLFATVALLDGPDFHRELDWKVHLEDVAAGRRAFVDVFDEHYQERATDVD